MTRIRIRGGVSLSLATYHHHEIGLVLLNRHPSNPLTYFCRRAGIVKIGFNAVRMGLVFKHAFLNSRVRRAHGIDGFTIPCSLENSSEADLLLAPSEQFQEATYISGAACRSLSLLRRDFF